MSYEYDKSKFVKDANELIEQSIKIDKSGKLFEILTRLKDDGTPSYSHLDMAPLMNIYEYTKSIDRVEKAAMLKLDKTPIYNAMQMHYIAKGYEFHFAHEYIDMYAALNKNNEPIFNKDQMESIYLGFKLGLTKREVMKYTKLNKKGEAIYNCFEMDAIRQGYVQGLSEELIDIYAQLDKDEKPLLFSTEMSAVEYFIVRANSKQVQQLKDVIADGLSFEQFKAFVKIDIPAEKMRIYRSLYSLDCDEKTVNYIVSHGNKLTHDDLKKVKYILTCTKKIKELDKRINWEEVESLNPYNIVYHDIYNIDEMYENFAFNIYDLCSGHMSMTPSPDAVKVVEECLKNNLEPEQIHFLISSGYDIDEMKNVFKCLMKGIDFDKIKSLHKEAIDILEAEEIKAIFETDENSDKELY